MKLSTRARYGVRLMLALARSYGQGSVYLKDVAKGEEISESTSARSSFHCEARGS